MSARSLRVIDDGRWWRTLLNILDRHQDDMWGERDAVHEFARRYREITRPLEAP